jgi:hypothetical protein
MPIVLYVKFLVFVLEFRSEATMTSYSVGMWSTDANDFMIVAKAPNHKQI